MIDENNFIITDFFQYLILLLFAIFLYFRRNTLYIEEKFLENLIIFFIIGSGFKVFGLSIYDEIFLIFACYIILFVFLNFKKIKLFDYIKKNYLILFLILYLIFKLIENINYSNFIFFIRFFIIYVSLIILSLYFWTNKIRFEIDYKLILNLGIFYFSLHLLLSYLIDIYFINHQIDISKVWNSFRTYQLDKFVFQNIFWQGISSSNVVILPFILLFTLKKEILNFKEILFLSIVATTSVYWHSMQLIFLLLFLGAIIVFKNIKNFRPIIFICVLSFLSLIIISSTIVKPNDKNLNYVEKNSVNFKNYINQFSNLKQIFGNVFSFNNTNNVEFENLQSYSIIDISKDEFYFIRSNKNIIIKNISLQDKTVPILLSLKKSRDLGSVLFGDGFRSYRDTVPELWSKNLEYFKYKSKEDEYIKNLELKNNLKSEKNNNQPFTECKLDKKTGFYSCNSYLNYTKYKSPTTLIASIYDYGYFFIILILIFFFTNFFQHRKQFLNLFFIYIFLFLFAFTCDLSDSLIFYFFVIFTTLLINNEKVHIKYLS